MTTAANKAGNETEHVELGRLSRFLGFRFRRVQNQLSRDFVARTSGWKLRAGMFSSLEIIAANPGISQALLSAEVGLDKSAIVPLVDDLEQRGWVMRTRSKLDRRRNHLSVTDLGLTELEKLAGHMAMTESTALVSLTDAERNLISMALDKVHDAYVRRSHGVT